MSHINVTHALHACTSPWPLLAGGASLVQALLVALEKILLQTTYMNVTLFQISLGTGFCCLNIRKVLSLTIFAFVIPPRLCANSATVPP